MNKLFLSTFAILVSASLLSQEPRFESFTIKTPSKENAELKVSVRLPSAYAKEKARVMILFGGRNWDSEKTLKSYEFEPLADRHMLVLLSPGFKDDDYWEPEKWSGKALLDAVAEARKRYAIPEGRMLYYGYSAGAQCANLFMAWKPEMVEAWGCHACGVWHASKKLETPIPALITCGEEDAGRVQTSQDFAQSYRECGNTCVLKLNLGGHELPQNATMLAEAFFDSILSSPERKVLFVGDDQLGRYFPAKSKEAKEIPEELRNEFYSEALAKLWQEAR